MESLTIISFFLVLLSFLIKDVASEEGELYFAFLAEKKSDSLSANKVLLFHKLKVCVIRKTVNSSCGNLVYFS